MGINFNDLTKIVFNGTNLTKVTVNGTVVWPKAVQYRWNGYNYGQIYTLQQIASGTKTVNTTRWGKLTPQSNLNNITTGGNFIDGYLVANSTPGFDFSNVSGGDMPTRASGYNGYYTGANNNGIITSSQGYSAVGQKPGYIGIVTNYSSLFNFSFTFTADIYQYVGTGNYYKINNTIVTTAESDDPNAYPNGGIKDGYWWERAQ